MSFKRGIFVSNYDAYADPRRLVELARAAERGGWAGFFIWDHVWFRNNKPVADPWVVLAAVAATCPGLVVGPLITPLARRRPWKVAREVVTLQGLAEDVVLGVGLGVDEEYRVFEQEQVSEDSRRERGDRLDEALDVLERCWSGADVAHRGRHYDVRNPVDDAGARIEVRFTPVPPRPVRLWGAARVGADDRPYRRAGERLDGIVPVADKYDPDAPLSAADLERVAERVAVHRTRTGEFDLAYIGQSLGHGPPAGSEMDRLAGAGMTWWLEDLHHGAVPVAAAVDRVSGGPVV